MRGGEVAANKVRTTTKEYSAAAVAVFFLRKEETEWYSGSTKCNLILTMMRNDK